MSDACEVGVAGGGEHVAGSAPGVPLEAGAGLSPQDEVEVEQGQDVGMGLGPVGAAASNGSEGLQDFLGNRFHDPEHGRPGRR